MAKKTQTELEQPAKVYQLDAVETKVDLALQKLDVIASQTTGVVSQHQLEGVVKDLKAYTDKEIVNVKEDVDKDYGPMKKAIGKFVWLVVAVVLSIIGQIYMIVTISRLGK